MLMIQMNPRHVRLAAIAAGRYDAYLARYAAAARLARAPVVFSFAHEMNGPWYPWGYGHTPPAVFVAAWRHMHDIFALAGAGNVIWCWNPNRPAGILGGAPNIAPSHPWWPGTQYVDWVGIDAYYRTPDATFGAVFGSALAQVRAFTRAPVLIAETGAAPGPWEPGQIRSLFAGASRLHLVGVVWFDIASHKDWQLEGHPAAMAAFRAAAAQFAR
jgi:beta-mannanase